MIVIILITIIIILVFVLVNKNKNNNNTSGFNIFSQNNEDVSAVKEKEKGNIDIKVKNIDFPQNDFNPFIYDRLYNPFYTYTYPNYNYNTSYPYYNYTYDIRPFPRQYPGRIHNYKSYNMPKHDGKRK
jgi:hypothetical protein